MSHAITIRASGKAEMAFTGDRSLVWHGLGNQLAEGAPIEEWIDAAGMDWKIQRSKVRYAIDREGTLAEMPDRHVLLRSDDKTPLGLVSDGFKIVQPREVLEFFRDLVEQAGFKLTTAGTLHGGKKFWAQADLGEGGDVVFRDFVGGRLLLATACDGSMNTVAKGVSERVVCANTLGFAMAEKGGSMVKVSHRSVFDEAKVKKQLGVAVPAFLRFLHQARELAHREVSPVEAEAFVLALMGGNGDEKHDDKVRESAGYRKVLALFDGEGRGAQMAGVRGTAWGLLNSVTEYVDHHVRARSVDNRFDSAEFGAGDELKTHAFGELVKLI